MLDFHVPLRLTSATGDRVCSSTKHSCSEASGCAIVDETVVDDHAAVLAVIVNRAKKCRLPSVCLSVRLESNGSKIEGAHQRPQHRDATPMGLQPPLWQFKVKEHSWLPCQNTI